MTHRGAFSKGGHGKVPVGEIEKEGKWELAGAWQGRGHKQGWMGAGVMGKWWRGPVLWGRGVFRAAAQGLSGGIRLHS